MGINPLAQNMQVAGLPDIDKLAGNAMYPQSQMDKTQYAVSNQMPTSAEVVSSDYDAPTNAYTGMPGQRFAKGGLPTLRFDGEDGSQVEAPVEEEKPKTMAELADAVKQAYRTNANYDQLWKDFAATKEQDPQAWYKHQLDFLGNQVGWQLGQNTGDRVKAIQPQIDNTIEEAKKAGLKEEEINNILNSSSQQANITNQNRIAQEAAKGQGWVNQNIPGGYKTLAIAAALAAGGIGAAGLLGEGALGAAAGEGLGLGAAEGLTTADILGSTFTGSQFAIDPALAYTAAGGAAAEGLGGAAAGEAASQGLTLKDAYNAYKYGKMGLNAVNALSGAGGGSGGAASGAGYAPAASGYTAFNPAVSSVGLPGMSAYEKTPWANLMPQITLSKLSEFAPQDSTQMASGGIAHLGGYSDGGRLLKGPGDGMSDNIPATISNKQPARLADGEFVVPADVVSHLGNGSTDAGAKQLYAMMDKVRKARTGNKKQGKQINPNKFLPKG